MECASVLLRMNARRRRTCATCAKLKAPASQTTQLPPSVSWVSLLPFGWRWRLLYVCSISHKILHSPGVLVVSSSYTTCLAEVCSYRLCSKFDIFPHSSCEPSSALHPTKARCGTNFKLNYQSRYRRYLIGYYRCIFYWHRGYLSRYLCFIR